MINQAWPGHACHLVHTGNSGPDPGMLRNALLCSKTAFGLGSSAGHERTPGTFAQSPDAKAMMLQAIVATHKMSTERLVVDVWSHEERAMHQLWHNNQKLHLIVALIKVCRWNWTRAC